MISDKTKVRKDGRGEEVRQQRHERLRLQNQNCLNQKKKEKETAKPKTASTVTLGAVANKFIGKSV